MVRPGKGVATSPPGRFTLNMLNLVALAVKRLLAPLAVKHIDGDFFAALPTIE